MLRLIRVDNVPSILHPDSVQRQNAEDFVASKVTAGDPPRSADFRPLWSNPDVRKKLWKMHNGRCCYCERLRDSSRESDIEHFRPKTKVAEKSPTSPGYWWLAYVWANLFFACKTCNETHKKTHFPVRGSRATSPNDSLDEEDACLLDPAEDDIEGTIGFDWIAEAGSVLIYGVGENAERGMKTVKLVGLNRPSLAKERWEALWPLQTIALKMFEAQKAGVSRRDLQQAARDIRAITSRTSAAPFIGMKRKFFQTLGLGDLISTD